MATSIQPLVVTFQQERWPAIREEVKGIAFEHWETVALEKDRVKLDLDDDLYDRLDAQNILHVTTVRVSGRLVGYFAMNVTTHPHYRTLLCAFLDSYFICAEFRKGTLGLRLFEAMEAHMRSLGVKRMVAGLKLHYDVSPVFQRLGWKLAEKTFIKSIGD